jgi:two-component system response regulator CpxR
MTNQTEAPGTRLLLVDDDAELCELVSHYLSARGFSVETEGDGERGLALAQSGDYTLMVLDVMLPGLDGLEVLRRLRSSPHAGLPVMMLTAHGDEVDRIVGLELGADDYLSKPFNPRELLARINAVLRRTHADAALKPAAAPSAPESPAERVGVGDVELDAAARSVRRGREPVELTAVEFDLLYALLRAAGRVVSREELSHDVLQRKLLPFDRSLDMHLSKLRRKLGPAAQGGERIKTVRGVGYIYVKEG